MYNDEFENSRSRQIFYEAAQQMESLEIEQADEKLMYLAKELLERPEAEIDDAYAAYDDNKNAMLFWHETCEYVAKLKAENVSWS